MLVVEITSGSDLHEYRWKFTIQYCLDSRVGLGGVR